MSPTVTAFLLSCMCFASINISVTNAETKLDLIFVVQTSGVIFKVQTSNTLIKQVAAEAKILIGEVGNFKTALIHAKNPPSIVVPLAQYNQTEFEAAVDETIVLGSFIRNIHNTLLTAKNVFEASEISGATSCGSLQVLVLMITSFLIPQNKATFMTNAQLIRDADIVSIGVQIASRDEALLKFLASGNTTSNERVHDIGINSNPQPAINGINTDIRRAVQAASCTPCDSNPCMNGGTCNNIHTDTDYWCECVGKFAGKNCQFCI